MPGSIIFESAPSDSVQAHAPFRPRPSSPTPARLPSRMSSQSKLSPSNLDLKPSHSTVASPPALPTRSGVPQQKPLLTASAALAPQRTTRTSSNTASTSNNPSTIDAPLSSPRSPVKKEPVEFSPDDWQLQADRLRWEDDLARAGGDGAVEGRAGQAGGKLA